MRPGDVSLTQIKGVWRKNHGIKVSARSRPVIPVTVILSSIPVRSEDKDCSVSASEQLYAC